jgi:NAD(P)-dependent dehydrogenase (short-subunit alcohol dehydrogenase family)
MHPEIEDLFDLKGQVAVVTGGARNLGFDAASILAASGCNVAITSRDIGSAREAADRLSQAYQVDVLPLQLDQNSATQVAELEISVRRWKGRLDILVNNAGGGSGSSKARLFERDPQDIEDLIRTNLTGTIYCCRALGAIMAERRSGKIINIASMAGLIGRDRRMYERAGMNGQPD